MVNDNGILVMFIDDFVEYMLDNGFMGMDILIYIIQDQNFFIDIVMVDVEVLVGVGFNFKVFFLGVLWFDILGIGLMCDDLCMGDYIFFDQLYLFVLNLCFV